MLHAILPLILGEISFALIYACTLDTGMKYFSGNWNQLSKCFISVFIQRSKFKQANMQEYKRISNSFKLNENLYCKKRHQQQQRYQSKVCLIQIFVKAVLFCDICNNVGVKSWIIFESHANISQTAHYFFSCYVM